MGLLNFNYRSEVLKYYVNVAVIYPTDGFSYLAPSEGIEHMDKVSHWTYSPDMKLQTLYLIHGGGDDSSLVYRYTNIERYAQEHCLMVVIPDIPNSFGVDTSYGVNYQTFLSKELPRVVQSLFASSPKREDNFIMGFAMGGNVALGTALMNPDLYSVCVDMSGGIGMTLDTEALMGEMDLDHFKKHFPLYESSFTSSDKLKGSRFDIYAATEKAIKDGVKLPKIHVLCGTEEFIRKRVEKDVELMKELQLDVEYECIEGGDHNYDLWDPQMRRYLSEILPLKRNPVEY